MASTATNMNIGGGSSESMGFDSLAGFMKTSTQVVGIDMPNAVIVILMLALLGAYLVCKYDLVPGLREKYPIIDKICPPKKQVCFAGETCAQTEQESDESVVE